MNRILISLALMLFAACANEQSDPEKTTIAVIPKGTTHEFWKSIHAGAVKAQRELDIEIIWKGPLKEDDREDQIALIENFISRGVSGIVLAPLDDTALRVPVANAVRSGIPVVIIDSGLQSDDFVSFVATDNYRGGRLPGADMAQRLNQKGKVIMLRYQEGSASTMKREQGFLDAIGEHSDIVITSSNQHGGATTESAYQASENLLAPLKDTNRQTHHPGHLLPQRIHLVWHAARPARRGASPAVSYSSALTARKNSSKPSKTTRSTGLYCKTPLEWATSASKPWSRISKINPLRSVSTPVLPSSPKTT